MTLQASQSRRGFDEKAYELHQLRTEVATLRDKVESLTPEVE
ncbi:hypothetical protein [Cryobacterium sp. TMT2-15-1]|nr:hypothetical protein [Cryobacterium sp. TMT2-15-1]